LYNQNTTSTSMQLRPLQRFATDHGDVIHDICYDWYGKRLATCSSDQTIKVFDVDGDGQWHCVTDFKAHQSAVWKVKWAHPEFGQILASASFDRTVRIWEEMPGRVKNWVKKATLFDSTRSVQDIKFAPRHLGLKLATCSKEGRVRIYEAADITNLTAWTLKAEDDFLSGKEELNCIDWNPSPFDPAMLVTGGLDGVAKIWEYHETTRKWNHVGSLKSHSGDIRDVAWAPHLGQPVHKIATAGKDKSVRIWEITLNNSGSNRTVSKVEEVARFNEHKAEVWRVEWNTTGTILASSGDDGMVRFWKANLAGQWQGLLGVKPDPSQHVPPHLPASSSSSSGSTTGSTPYFNPVQRQPPSGMLTSSSPVLASIPVPTSNPAQSSSPNTRNMFAKFH